MNASVMQQLVWKDCQLSRVSISVALAAGAAALAVFELGGEIAGVVGSVSFFVALVVLACMLPMQNIINERKKQNLAFAMSLPVSPVQYTAAKIVSTVGIFVLPWLALVGMALVLIRQRADLPNGIIPFTLVLAALVLTGFCIITAVALVSESEGWTTSAIIVCNVSYSLGWYFLIREPAINTNLGSPVAVWSPAILGVLGAEAAAIVLILGVAMWLQSMKRDFV